MASKLNGAQLETLWVKNGGEPALAPTMAAIALAESQGNPAALNNNASSGDFSVGLWQINYYGNLGPDRTAKYGAWQQQLNPFTNAKAAVDLAKGGNGLSNWSTFTSGAYIPYLSKVPGGQNVDPASGKMNLRANFGAQDATPAPPQKNYGDPKNSPALPPTSIGGFLPKLSSADFWIRAGQVIGGAILAFAGLFLLIKQIGLATPSAPTPVAAVAGALS